MGNVSDYLILIQIDGNPPKPRISKMHNVRETQKNVSKHTDNWVSDTSIFVILADFASKFWYKPLTHYREYYQTCISVKILFLSKIIMLGFDSLPSKNVLYNGAKSEKNFFTCGIPQGSILGPLFFIAYMKDTFDVFNYLYIFYMLMTIAFTY